MNFNGNSFIWILLICMLMQGNGCGCGGGNICGGCDSSMLILLLFIIMFSGNGFGCGICEAKQFNQLTFFSFGFKQRIPIIYTADNRDFYCFDKLEFVGVNLFSKKILKTSFAVVLVFGL